MHALDSDIDSENDSEETMSYCMTTMVWIR